MPPLVRIITLPTGAALVRLTGELDVSCAPALDDHFVGALDISPVLLVDMRAVTFVDAAIIGTLVRTQQSATDAGGCVLLVGADPWISKVLRVGGVDGLLPQYPDLRTALDSLPGRLVG